MLLSFTFFWQMGYYFFLTAGCIYNKLIYNNNTWSTLTSSTPLLYLSISLPLSLFLSLFFPSPTSYPQTVIPWALESWAEYDIKVYAKEGDLEKYGNSEHALCVLNHRGDLDWMIGWVLIERMGMLGVSFTFARLIMFVLICHVRTFSTTVYTSSANYAYASQSTDRQHTYCVHGVRKEWAVLINHSHSQSLKHFAVCLLGQTTRCNTFNSQLCTICYSFSQSVFLTGDKSHHEGHC